jgi:hypothetical protein
MSGSTHSLGAFFCLNQILVDFSSFLYYNYFVVIQFL